MASPKDVRTQQPKNCKTAGVIRSSGFSANFRLGDPSPVVGFPKCMTKSLVEWGRESYQALKPSSKGEHDTKSAALLAATKNNSKFVSRVMAQNDTCVKMIPLDQGQVPVSAFMGRLLFLGFGSTIHLLTFNTGVSNDIHKQIHRVELDLNPSPREINLNVASRYQQFISYICVDHEGTQV